MKKPNSNSVDNAVVADAPSNNAQIGVTILAGNPPSQTPSVKPAPCSMDELFEITLYRGYCQGYKNRTIIVEIQAKMYQKGDVLLIPMVKLLDAVVNTNIRNEVISSIKEYRLKTNIDIDYFIEKAEALLEAGEFSEINDLDTDKLAPAMKNDGIDSYIKELRRYFEEYPEEFVTCSSNEFNPDLHQGVFLDTSDYRRKFGENAIGVTPEFLRTNIYIKEDLADTGRLQQMSTNLMKDINDNLVKRGILIPYSSARKDWKVYYREDKSFEKRAYVFSMDKLRSI